VKTLAGQQGAFPGRTVGLLTGHQSFELLATDAQTLAIQILNEGNGRAEIGEVVAALSAHHPRSICEARNKIYVAVESHRIGLKHHEYQGGQEVIRTRRSTSGPLQELEDVPAAAPSALQFLLRRVIRIDAHQLGDGIVHQIPRLRVDLIDAAVQMLGCNPAQLANALLNLHIAVFIGCEIGTKEESGRRESFPGLRDKYSTDI